MLNIFKPKKKPKIAIVSLTSCEGCQFVMLDLGKRFLDLLKNVDINEFHLLEDEKEINGHYDIVFVEGNPITKENFQRLKNIRKKAAKLVVLGNCADLGGVWEIKNYHDKNKIVKYVYKTHSDKIENPDVREVDNFVEVDFAIPTCPIDGEEFLRVFKSLIKGKIPKIKQVPVCDECSKQGTKDCYLVKGEVCLGTISFAGCQAVCPNNNQPCYGCRGLRDNIESKALKSLLDNFYKKHSKKEVNDILEFFGLKDSIIKKLKTKNEIKN